MIEAVAVLQDLLRRNPDYPYALGMLVMRSRRRATGAIRPRKKTMVEAVRAGKRAASPLALLAVSDSPRTSFLLADS
jgi:hypothetical protein